MTKSINPQLASLIASAAEKTKTKASLPLANVANRIATHLMRRCPELCAIPGLWFSGSNVWPFLYGKEPPTDADIDVFLVGATDPDGFDDPRVNLCKQLGIAPDDMTLSGVQSGFDGDLYMQGVKALYKGNKLDIWECGETPWVALRNYPTKSHAHCRAAFSFADGLIVLPNEMAMTGPIGNRL